MDQYVKIFLHCKFDFSVFIAFAFILVNLRLLCGQIYFAISVLYYHCTQQFCTIHLKPVTSTPRVLFLLYWDDNIARHLDITYKCLVLLFLCLVTGLHTWFCCYWWFNIVRAISCFLTKMCDEHLLPINENCDQVSGLVDLKQKSNRDEYNTQHRHKYQHVWHIMYVVGVGCGINNINRNMAL